MARKYYIPITRSGSSILSSIGAQKLERDWKNMSPLRGFVVLLAVIVALFLFAAFIYVHAEQVVWFLFGFMILALLFGLVFSI